MGEIGCRCHGLDFAIDDIQEILAMRDQQEASCRVVLDLLAERTEEIGRRISELQCMENELRELHRAVCSVSMGKHHCNSKQREASAKGKGKS